MTRALSRRRALEVALFAFGAALASRTGARAAARGPLLSFVGIGNGGRPFASDGERLTTVGRAHGRTTTRLRFRLARPARVSLDVLETGQGGASERPVPPGQTGVSPRVVSLPTGEHTLSWRPDATLAPRTYVLRLSARDRAGRRVATSAVARVLGVDAAFPVASARPGDAATLTI